MPRPTRRTGGGHQRAAVARRPLADTISALVVPEGASLVLITPTVPTDQEREMVGDALAQAGLLGRCVMLVGDYGTGIVPTDQLLDIIHTPAVLADLRASVGEQVPDDVPCPGEGNG